MFTRLPTNRRIGGKAAQRSGANFQKVVVMSANISGLLSLTELPPSGGRYVTASKFIRQEMPTDFIGCVRGSGRFIAFDAKSVGDDYASFPLNNVKMLKPHQAAFLRAAHEAGGLAGLLVESKRVERYLWLHGFNLHLDRIDWADAGWVDLGPTTGLIQFGNLLGSGAAVGVTG